jgi:hypothetical protein
MKHATNCKFCKKPITVTIDDAYAELGDPLNLIRIASCNECADIRVERRKLEGKIGFACDRVVRAGKMDEEERLEHYDGLRKLTQEYAGMISRWHHKEGLAWEEEVVRVIIDNPKQWREVISKLWTMFAQWQRKENEKSLL